MLSKNKYIRILFQILTLRTIAFVANVAATTFIVTQKTFDKYEIPISSSHFPSSTFIDLNNSSDEDVSMLMSFDVNVYGSFLRLVLEVYTMEGMPLNLNQVWAKASKL